MQRTSYKPLYNQASEVNVSASGFSWHQYNSNTNYREEKGHNISLPPFDMKHFLRYDKEVLRQIIQNHEATFRYQVQELHRLYKRQRELMDEKRAQKFFGQHLLSQTSEPIHCFSQSQSDIGNTSSHATSWFIGDQSHGNKLSELTTDYTQPPSSFMNERFKEHSTVCSDPSIRMNSCDKIKLMSLDLEFPADVDHEDEGKHFKEGNLSEHPNLTCNTPEKLPYIIPSASDSEIGSNLNGSKTKFIIDLNQPVELESQPSSPMEIMHNAISTATPESVAAKLSGLGNCHVSSDGTNSSLTIDLNRFPESEIALDCISPYDETRKDKFVQHHPPIKDTKMEFLTNETSIKLIDGDGLVVDDTSPPLMDDKFLKNEKTRIDLNDRFVIDEPSPPLLGSILAIKSARDNNTELEGPVSPENEEGSPPSGRSEDTRLDTLSLLSKHGEREPSMELDIVAAQTLAMISSSMKCRDCLCWFADIVSSSGDDLDKKFMELQIDADDKDQGENDDTSLSAIAKKAKGTGILSGKKRLPSLVSLSSNDLHTVEGVLEKGSRKRNAGKKKACTKPRKYSKLSSSSLEVVKKPTCDLSKEVAPQVWGKTRKRGAVRRPREDLIFDSL